MIAPTLQEFRPPPNAARVTLANGRRVWMDSRQLPRWKKMLARDSYDEMWFSGDFGGVAVDVGAHVGLVTLHLAPHVDHVFAFEPNPRSAALFRANMQENGVKNVTLIPKAVADFDGRVGLMLEGPKRRRSDGQVQISADGDIPCVTLDRELRRVRSRITVIKIDAEGCGLRVLRGARRLLRNVKLIEMEINGIPDPLSRRKTGRSAVRFLARYGFKVVAKSKGNCWLRKV